MTQTEFKALPLYSKVMIDFGNPAYQFIGALVCKWVNPVNPNDVEGQVYVERHNGSDMHTVIWARIQALSVVEARDVPSTTPSESDIMIKQIATILRDNKIL